MCIRVIPLYMTVPRASGQIIMASGRPNTVAEIVCVMKTSPVRNTLLSTKHVVIGRTTSQPYSL